MDAAARPLPSEEITPPVTNTNFDVTSALLSGDGTSGASRTRSSSARLPSRPSRPRSRRLCSHWPTAGPRGTPAAMSCAADIAGRA